MKYTVAAGFVLLGILAWLLPPQSDENRSKDTDVSVSTGVYQTEYVFS